MGLWTVILRYAIRTIKWAWSPSGLGSFSTSITVPYQNVMRFLCAQVELLTLEQKGALRYHSRSRKLRCPISITAKLISPRQNLFFYGKIYFFTVTNRWLRL